MWNHRKRPKPSDQHDAADPTVQDHIDCMQRDTLHQWVAVVMEQAKKLRSLSEAAITRNQHERQGTSEVQPERRGAQRRNE